MDSHISIGIDASADTVSLCALDCSGRVLGEHACAASAQPIVAFASELGSDHPIIFGIESGSMAIPLTRSLRRSGYEVKVLANRPAATYLRLRQNKTDPNDARGLADIVRLGLGGVPDVLVKSEQCQMLRTELVMRHRLMKQRIAIEGAMGAVFRLNGGKVGRVYTSRKMEARVNDELKLLKQQGVDLTQIVKPTLAIAVLLRRTLELTDHRLRKIAKAHEVCRRLMSVPGVGVLTAISFYTAVEDPARFEKNNDVGPYLGLVPTISQSGNSLISKRISRMGNRMTRTHLVSAAKTLMQLPNADCALQRWALQIAERSGRGKARVALARKMAVVMLAMWKSGESFRGYPA